MSEAIKALEGVVTFLEDERARYRLENKRLGQCVQELLTVNADLVEACKEIAEMKDKTLLGGRHTDDPRRAHEEGANKAFAQAAMTAEAAYMKAT